MTQPWSDGSTCVVYGTDGLRVRHPSAEKGSRPRGAERAGSMNQAGLLDHARIECPRCVTRERRRLAEYRHRSLTIGTGEATRKFRRRGVGDVRPGAAVLALGLGMSTAMYTVYRTVLVERLPVVDAQRLVVLTLASKTGTEIPGSRAQ